MPIIFLHGFLGSPLDWEPLFKYLPKENCLAIELPGHGSTPFAPEWEMPLPKAHLVGYSLGGRIAAMFAQKHPERVLSLTLLSTHPGLITKEEKRERLKSDETWAELLCKEPMEKFLEKWYAQPLFASWKPDFERRKKHSPKELAKTLLHYSLSKQKRIEMKGVLVGEWDTKFRALHPDGILIEKAGHQVHLENPQAVANVIRTHFSKCPKRL